MKQPAYATVALILLLAAPFALAQGDANQNAASSAPPGIDSASRVTLSLAEYERLRGPDRPENIVVVDTLRISGTFKDRNLAATFIGKSVGKHGARPVLHAASGLSVWGCSGNALVSRGDDAFLITPLADSFTTTCRITAAGSDRLELVATREVLAIESNVPDGELVAAERNADGSSRYSLVRQSGGAGENLAPTATGHYLITLLPDETRFRYAIDVHNPNRSRRPFEVRLHSGEHVQKVDADAAYEIIDGAYRFDLPPGDMTLVLSGQLSGDSFIPPVDTSLQYLAIENHPIIRPMINGAVKRVSAGEAGVPIQFRGPQAFLLGKGETIHWQKTKLETLHTVSYAVSGIRHTFFIPAEGLVLGESVFGIDNQGASDVKLPLNPEPTYASIQSEPLMMTRGSDGKLTIPLSAGKQEILVQHRQGIRHFLGIGVGRLLIPQLTVPATSLLVKMNYPRQWYPLLQLFSTRTRFWFPPAEMALIFLALLLWTERTLAYLLVPLKERLAIAVTIAAAAAAFDSFAILVALGDSFLTVAWLVPQLKKEKWTFLKLLLSAAVVGAGLLLFWFDLRTRKMFDFMATPGSGGLAGVSSEAPPTSGETRELFDEAAQQRNAMNLGYLNESSKKVSTYQGLPARFEIPGGERHSFFGQEMLSTDREQSVQVLLISSTIVWLFGILLVALAVTSVWKARQWIAAGVRSRFATVGPEVPVLS
jgi:hypothetical protein